jgi:hypothetical protein
VGDPVLAKLDAKTVEKEAELEELRKAAWEKRNGILCCVQQTGMHIRCGSTAYCLAILPG